MSDIVEQLRERVASLGDLLALEAATAIEARDAEIARLREDLARTERNRDMWKGQVERQSAEIARLREVLEPFALVAEYDIGDGETDADVFRPMSAHNRAPKLRVGYLRRARAALKVSP